ncbi:MAG: endopeptidase La [Desulfarculales bacterium]|jgi:ATP-dependent Lon protease|nr:endopeptidase La [Desulfarculales bacterium]
MPDDNLILQAPEIYIKAVQEDEQSMPVILPEVLPIIAVREFSLFPHMIMPMHLFNPGNQMLFTESLTSHKQVGLALLKENAKPNEITSLDQLYSVGMEALVLKMVRTENDGIRLMVQGMNRICLLELLQSEPYLRARVSALSDIASDDLETQALMSTVKKSFTHFLDLAPQLPNELNYLANGINSPGSLADLVAGTINLMPLERQSVLEELKVKARLHQVNFLLAREIQVLELGNKIHSKVKDALDKNQRDFYLRQKIKAIQNELGENEDINQEVSRLKTRLQGKVLPDQVREETARELKRMAQMNPSTAEYQVVMDYVEWILALPWEETTSDNLDLRRAGEILNQRHYGLEKIKRRILEYLAVLKLNPDLKGPILCLSGPPGVGKTSLGKSIAQALGRKFTRLSLGGVRDEAEIRGHRRTYVGAMPGRIIQSLRRAGSKNPVFILDEIDKLGEGIQGSPASALLEVLDPEQNNTFSDHYLDLPFDLSKVMFITTANRLDTIPPPLRDRMEVLEIAGYTREEKYHIARRYLIPKVRASHGLKASQFKISDKALNLVIASYTKEAGLRNLEREIGTICRFAALQVAEGIKKSAAITPKEVNDILGPENFVPEAALRKALPGVATGLAWTPTGGDILFIEATAIPGSGNLHLTGQLGEVMKESAQTALSYLKANGRRFGIAPEFFAGNDIHVHVPAGAIPKDGPSAGVTIFTALFSLMTNRPVRVDVAMTGEITLRGLVLAIGGIKEKVLAAQQAGIKTVLLPKRNQRDLSEVPESARKNMRIIFVDEVSDLIQYAIAGESKARREKAAGTKSGDPQKKAVKIR